MKFKDFLQEGKVQLTTKGEQQAKSLQKMSLQTQQALEDVKKHTLILEKKLLQ